MILTMSKLNDWSLGTPLESMQKFGFPFFSSGAEIATLHTPAGGGLLVKTSAAATPKSLAKSLA